MNVVVVGRGVLGLSIAEFLSRNSRMSVAVLSSPLHPAASAAAAANLSTKAQVFARDEHFRLKLEAKMIYRSWLSGLRRENNEEDPEDLSGLFQQGKGRDVFFDRDACTRQWKRVMQSPHEIEQRGLQPQKIHRPDPLSIEYEDEAWVCAQGLLRLLESVCRKRGVQFVDGDALNVETLREKFDTVDHVVVSAGGHTPKIVSAWGCRSDDVIFQKSRRWSYGATLEISVPSFHLPTEISLLEVIPASGALDKITFSGSSEKLFCSSLSVKCTDRGFASDPEPHDPAVFAAQHEHLREILRGSFSCPLEASSWRIRTGLRLGFGHSELLLARLPVPLSLRDKVAGALIVATGAHKSGFLFAPLMGEQVLQKMQP